MIKKLKTGTKSVLQTKTEIKKKAIGKLKKMFDSSPV